MNRHDHTPLYKYEDKLVSIHIGKPHVGNGAFFAVDGNVQFGFTNNQYEEMLVPLLRAINNESIDGIFKFYQSQNSGYRLQIHALMLVINKPTGESLKAHVKEVLIKLGKSD